MRSVDSKISTVLQYLVFDFKDAIYQKVGDNSDAGILDEMISRAVIHRYRITDMRMTDMWRHI